MKAIRFLDEWKKYPGAIVHTSTTNKSFVELAQLYKSMGVKNYFFHLALLDPDLEHVDPFSEELDVVTIGKIAREVKNNPWYYLREIARFPPKGGTRPVRYRANRGNIAAAWSFLCHLTFSNTQPRQTGKSSGAEQLCEWMVDGGTSHATLGLVTKDAALRDQTIARIKLSRFLKPGYLLLSHPKDTDNNVRIDNFTLDNHIVTAVAQKSAMAADNTLRGFSTPSQWWDEPPFISFLEKAMTSAGPAYSNASTQAKEANNPYGIIYTTTAGDRNTRDGAYYYSLLQGGMIWSEYLLDMPDEAFLNEEVHSRCPGHQKLINGTFSHRQLGLSDDWLKETIGKVGGTKESINKDFFNIWGTGGGKSPHSVFVQKALQNGKKDPCWEERFDSQGYRHYVIRWHIPKERIGNYMMNNTVVVGCDTSSAVGRDSITMVGIDPKTLETIFTFNVNETNVIRFAEFVAHLLVKYERIAFIPEYKSTGISLVDKLLLVLPSKGINPYKRIFNQAIDDADADRERYSAALNHRHSEDSLTKNKTLFGYATSGSGKFSRDNLYVGTMSFATSRACHNVRDIMLTNELLGLQEKNGRIDHGTSGHDDHVISWLLAVWWLMAGKNLSDYGIRDQFSRTVELDEDALVSASLREQKMKQNAYREELDDLVEKYRGERDTFKRKRLEARLRVLDHKLDGPQDYGSIGELLDTVSAAKASKHMARRSRFR